MCFVLVQHFFVFEKIGIDWERYINLKDYLIYSKEERQCLINADLYVANDFLSIPTLDVNEMAAEYLLKVNNRSLWRRRHTNTFYDEFYDFVQDNLLYDDWRAFEKEKLLQYGMKWCQKNQIKYTLKEISDHQ